MDGLFGRYKVILAPMAGVTDVAFRQLCIEQGADLAFTEMVSAKGLSYANEKTRHLLEVSPNEDSVGVQIFGNEPDVMAEQAKWIQEELGSRLAFVDINMGCPARKIVKKGDGAALMKDPRLASVIVEKVSCAVDVPVTAKFRRGYFEGRETAPEFAKALEQAGASAVTVHGRYATQMYRGASDRECIARVKENVSIPVVGNGDVKSGGDAASLVRETGCDAVMIARGAQGNPWIFGNAKRALGDGLDPGYERPAGIVERIGMARRHARLLAGMGDHQVLKMRKHAPCYIKGLDGAASARGMLSTCSTLEEFEQVFDMLEERAENAA